ncbi:MAG: lytic transglycosylase domain-containing protein [Burkholderiales bacterium]
MTRLRLCAASLVLFAPCALAARLEIPLRLPLEPLREAIAAQLAASKAKPKVIYSEGPCRYINLDKPRLEAVEGRLRLVGPGSAAFGVELFGGCQNAARWQGSMEFTFVPQLDNAGRLRLRIVDSKFTDAGGGAALGFIWELSKRYVHPRLERFSYDLGASRQALASIVRGAAPPQHAAELEAAVRQLQVLEPRVEAKAVVVPIALELPDAWLAAPVVPVAAAPAAPLSEAELEALEKTLQPWDAFLLYSIKQVALDSENSALRKRLFTVLLESRYRLIEILSADAPAAGDPLRELFVDAWEELRTILAEGQRDGALDASLLRYAAFIDAGDALLALDRAAPGLGMTLSSEGLRQIARSLRPGAAGDPLAYDWAADPQLRRLFGVEEIPDSEPPPSSPPSSPPTRSWLDLFLPRAYAAEPAAEKALDRWLPRRDELDAYEVRIGQLLKKTAAAELQRASLAAPYDNIYRNMVPTTALIESCWRQYAMRGGKVSYLRSGSGSIGIMQINQIVWRGFYQLERLRWDTAYNARAGAQILMRYVKDYAIPYAEKSGDPNVVPRAAYAVYNAGPRAVGRFDKEKKHPREQRVDEHLWLLYRGLAAGGQADLRTCDVTTAAASR